MRSRANTALSVAMALILVAVVGGPVMWWRNRLVPPVTLPVRPVLDEGQLRGLITYKRDCETHEDCEEPLSCLRDARVGTSRCLASECETDLQCQPGYGCTLFPLLKAPSVRLCVIQGTQKEGDRCEHFPLNEERGCRPGLICQSGFCGRPCRLEDPSACPEGFVCQDGAVGPTCLPSCLRKACPPGRQCFRIKDEFAVCATLKGRDCDEVPCAPGEECRRVLGSRWWHAEVVKMWCSRPCDEADARSCPAGSICWNGYCERTCDEDASVSCAPGERCTKTFLPGRTATVCRILE